MRLNADRRVYTRISNSIRLLPPRRSGLCHIFAHPGYRRGREATGLLYVTGSGKTFTMAKIIEQVNRLPSSWLTTKLSPPSYSTSSTSSRRTQSILHLLYDYYQPEASIPAGDIYIEKEATINDELDKLRSPLRALSSSAATASSSPASVAFTASARQKPITACCSSLKKDSASSAKTFSRAGRDFYERGRRPASRHLPRAR